MSAAYIYILLCKDGSYYTGITRRSIDERISEHENGIDIFCYTYHRRPVKLVYSCEFDRIDEAIATERQIKGWSRAKKQALINGQFERLPELSKNRQKKM